MQTLYKITAGKNHSIAPIESIHTEYDFVMGMKDNMEKAGWVVKLEYAKVDWKTVVE